MEGWVDVQLEQQDCVISEWTKALENVFHKHC